MEPIDGVGSILGQAGPCFVRSGSTLTVVGRMIFDEADVDNMESNGTLTDVITHELGHILGIGSLWDAFGLLQDPSLVTPGADTYFSGTQAISAFDGVGGASYVGNKVPVENQQGGSGTKDSHWRESVFDNELMTGFINSGANPLSAVTIASLADLGYTVDLGQADSYTLPSLAPPPPSAEIRPSIQLVRDQLGGPVYVVDSRGRVLGVIPR